MKQFLLIIAISFSLSACVPVEEIQSDAPAVETTTRLSEETPSGMPIQQLFQCIMQYEVEWCRVEE